RSSACRRASPKYRSRRSCSCPARSRRQAVRIPGEEVSWSSSIRSHLLAFGRELFECGLAASLALLLLALVLVHRLEGVGENLMSLETVRRVPGTGHKQGLPTPGTELVDVLVGVEAMH